MGAFMSTCKILVAVTAGLGTCGNIAAAVSKHKLLCQVMLGLNLFVNMLCAAGLMKLLCLLPLATNTKKGVSLVITQFAWRTALLFSPWVETIGDPADAENFAETLKVMDDANKDAGEGKKPYRPLMVLGNHSSFFDTMLFTCKVPTAILWKCRTYMDSGLFKLPILSTICISCGHYAVHFTSSEEGKFKVDAEKAAKVDVDVTEHLKTGGWLCFFPEGTCNKQPDTLLPFRFGGIKKALEYDSSFLCFVSVGNPAVWPKKAPVGGFPGKVRHSAKLIAPNGCKAYVAELRESKDISAEDKALEDVPLLAKHCQTVMQKQYDANKAALPKTGDKKTD